MNAQCPMPNDQAARATLSGCESRDLGIGAWVSMGHWSWVIGHWGGGLRRLARAVTRRAFAAWGGVCLSLLGEAAAAATGAAGHWAFQPVRPVELPAVRGSSWARSPLDRFILQKLEKAGLEPSFPARREQLIRRVSIGLIGLPPTPEEVDAFVNDHSPAAWGRLVDRLLDSPHYGERWARHWLDVVRYSESEGFERDWLRENAWRYRDYVIRSFNEDKPYNLFAKEQIAGDVLDPVTHDGITATGLLVLGP